MHSIQLNDEVRLLRPVQAQIIEMASNPETVDLPAGTTGAVVFVHGSTNRPEGFEIEFVIDPPKRYAIASVYARDVELEQKASR